MRKSLLSLFSLFMLATTMLAQGVPFRRHRYDGFKTHKVTSENIVFLGNSITNMHEWWEAFGNAKILNRGVNGAESPIMLEHLEATLAGRPDKIFFMMGTNDLGTRGMNDPAFVAKSVRAALKRCKNESPNTKVYFQSILPCTTNGVKDVKHIPITNDSIQKLCKEYGATYIDLYNDLKGIADRNIEYISYDGTHLTMRGYRTWCNKIAPYVGSNCVYPADASDENGGNGGIAGMRTTYFSALPINANDILILGEDGNDWHELLNSDHVKQRGTSWGYKSNDLGTMQKMLQGIFKGNKNNVAPKMVCLVLGYNEVNNTGNDSKSVDAIAASYKTFVEKVRSLAPQTAIRLMAVIPSDNANVNINRTKPLNEKLKAMAAEMDNVTYCEESYTMLVGDNNVIKEAYFPNFSGARYMSGLGYAKLSQAMAKAIGEEVGVTPTSDEEANARIATFNARNSLYNAISTAEAFPIGTKVGQYLAKDVTPLIAGIQEGYALLASESTTDKELSDKSQSYASLVNNVLPHIILPTLSTNQEEHWYQLYTPNRENKYTTSYGAGNALLGGDNTQYTNTMWKFVARTDGTWDIVNRADGTYISPASAYNKAINAVANQPNKGWKLSYSNAVGTFIISSDNVELNQTPKSLEYKIYNWSAAQNGQDRADAGCQFAIVDAPEVAVAPEEFLKGEIEISMSSGTMNGGMVNNIRYGSVWTSTRTAPQLKLAIGPNNIWVDNTDNVSLTLLTGTAQSVDYTLSVTPGYEITDISMDATTFSAQAGDLQITVGGQTETLSAQPQKLHFGNLKNNSLTLKVAGTNNSNKGVIARNFKVMVQKVGYVPPTSIVTVQPAVSNRSAVIYDLSGRRVNHATKGVFIINGKKVIK